MKKSRIVLIVAGVLVAGLGLAAAANRASLHRLYKVVTLFDRDVIVGNFRSADTIFPSRVMRAADNPSALPRRQGTLPATYVYQGAEKKIDDLIDQTWTTGFIVIKDGAIVHERYFRGGSASTKVISWSTAKSFVSGLVGIAVAEGYIKDIRDPVTDYVPQLKGSAYDGVKIKDILQMSSGVRFDENYGDFFSDINRMGRTLAFGTGLDDFIRSMARERTPGVYRHYVSMDTQVLGMLVAAATKRDISSYMEEKLWKKTGMESDAYWCLDGKGMEMVFGGLNAVLRDYARFGLLYLNGGRWNGEQVIPAAWVRDSTTATEPHCLPGKSALSSWVLGYGYQWWIPENTEGDFLAIGVYNQFIYIHPKYNVVIAKMSAYPDYTRDGEDRELQTIAAFRAIARNVR